ncbi:uncharacterized protein LOC142645934 [Dermatophagoides pteronyssinus]|uniref:uncharacterized protein LOC142645934 n=1 Tax=Dermatophagoides pteronyssinus TaxID=6956 RepID=UPI003F67BBCB
MTTSTTTTTTSTTIINRCSPKTFETCLSMMQEVMENSSLAFPINSKDLDITCRKLKSGDYCAEKYIRSCAGNRQRHLYQDIVQGSKNVIRLLCQQGRTQQLYLQYAPCLKDISISSQKCLTVVRRFQSISKMMSENEQQPQQQPEPINRQKNDNDLRLLKFCCAYQESVDCQLQNVRKYCGQEGLRFFEHYMSEMTNSLINQHCAGYTYSDKCKRLRRRPHNHNHNNNHQHRGSLDHHQSHQKSNHHQHQQQQQQQQLNPNRKFIYFNNSTFDRHLNYNSNQHNNEDYDDDIDNYYDNIDNDDDDSDNQNDGDRSSIDSDSNDYHNSILSTNGSIILFDSIRINLLIILLIIIMADQ